MHRADFCANSATLSSWHESALSLQLPHSWGTAFPLRARSKDPSAQHSVTLWVHLCWEIKQFLVPWAQLSVLFHCCSHSCHVCFPLTHTAGNRDCQALAAKWKKSSIGGKGAERIPMNRGWWPFELCFASHLNAASGGIYLSTLADPVHSKHCSCIPGRASLCCRYGARVSSLKWWMFQL